MKQIIEILEKANKQIETNEDVCYKKMAFCNEHNMPMEREAIHYQQQAYNNSKLILWSAIDKIKEILKKKGE